MERHILKTGELETRKFNPRNDEYPFEETVVKLPVNHSGIPIEPDNEHYEKSLRRQRIKYAIKFLQLECLKKFWEDDICDSLIDLMFCPYPIHLNQKAYEGIIRFLIEKLGTEKIIHHIIFHRIRSDGSYNELDELILFLVPVGDEVCKYCLITEPKEYLVHPCNCKTPVHAECFIKWFEYTSSDKCEICHSEFHGLNDEIHHFNGAFAKRASPYPKIFFPKDDLYPVPLMSRYPLEKCEGFERLVRAVTYLQVERVNELLQETEILEELPKYGVKDYCGTILHRLIGGNVGDNICISAGANLPKYIQILLAILDTKKVDIDAVDIWGLKADDDPHGRKPKFTINLLREYRVGGMKAAVTYVMKNVRFMISPDL